MSSGDVAAPAAGAIVAIPILAVAAVGVAAVLAIRACGAATEAAGRAAERLGEELERTAGKQDQAEIRGRLWQLAATEVVGINASIRMMQARAEQVGATVTLPKLLSIAGHSVPEIDRLVQATELALRSCREKLDQVSAAYEQKRLVASLPTPTGTSVTAADLLAEHQAMLQHRVDIQVATGDDDVPFDGVDRDQVRDGVARILRRLDIDATAAEREQVLRAAANATSRTSLGDTRTYLAALRTVVDNEINPRAARRREAATWLDALENPIVAEAIVVADPRPPFLDAMAKLRPVVNGDQDVTPELRRQARDALAWAERAAHRRRLMDAVQECLRDQHFAVEAGFSINHSPGLRASLPGWRGEHSADFWIDDEGNVHGDLLKDRDQVSNETQRCAELNTQLGVLAENLKQRGFTLAAATTNPHHKPQHRRASQAQMDGPELVRPIQLAQTPDQP